MRRIRIRDFATTTATRGATTTATLDRDDDDDGARVDLRPSTLRAATATRVDDRRDDRIAARRSNPNRDRRRAIERARDARVYASDADSRGERDVADSQAIVEAQTTHPVKTQSVEYSFARSGFASECERALNAQINVEYNVSYIYHAMWAYFSRR